MSHLFRFLGAPSADGDAWELREEEAHHVSRVLRLGEGAEVEVTDGAGRLVRGTLTQVGAKLVRVAVAAERRVERERGRFVFAVGALKPGGVDDVLAPLVELGVDAVRCSRSGMRRRIG
jgi:16S rRNA (uracil1498-N3)-methyltransferase